MKRGTLTYRLTWRFAVLVTITTATAFMVGGWLLQRQMLRGLERLNESECRELSGLLGQDVGLSETEIRRRIQVPAESETELYYIQVHDAAGAILFRSDNLGETVLPDLSGRGPHSSDLLPGVGPVRITELYSGPWHIQVASSTRAVARLLRDYVRVSGVLILAVAVVSIGLGYGFSQVMLKPVQVIEATARGIRAENLKARIPVPLARDELSGLA
jgi:HAMP domain-containing protein